MLRLPLAIALLATATLAQSEIRLAVAWGSGIPPQQHLPVTVTPVPAGIRPGGCGWVEVRVENSHRAPHDLRIRMGDSSPRSGIRVERRGRLESGETSSWFLPLPGTNSWMQVEIEVDGFTNRVPNSFESYLPHHAISALQIGASARHLEWMASLDGARRGRSALGLAQRTPDAVPLDASLMSGFQFVFLDARGVEVTPQLQSVLRDYARSGGSLGVLEPEQLAPGVLKELCGTTDSQGRGLIGFGEVQIMSLGRSFASPRELVNEAMGRGRSGWSGYVASGFRRTLDIPGLGDVPVRAFFALIAVFAFVVGPLNYFYWKRRRRLPMLLITVPAIGFGTTVVILLFGMFSEGFGARRAEMSVTVLDQRRHEAVCWSTSSVYAGLSPSRLTLKHRGYPSHNRPFDDGYRFGLGADGTFDAGFIQSRTLTSFSTSSLATTRERIRFRRRDDGKWEWLAGPELRPEIRNGDSRIVMRAADGRYWSGLAGTGSMSPVTRDEGRRLARSFVSGRVDLKNVGVVFPSRASDASTEAAAFDADGDLRVGSYVMRAESSPAFEDLGLEAEVVTNFHVVFGLLAEEDIVE